ncbi:MAG: BACON domain-containing protein [Bacteroidales bacterium]|nr:BACON domain-containing protein [Bacteroidales bacterium]
MKLFRYLLSALAGVALFASCIEEEPVANYKLAIDLDKSVVAVGADGGSATVEINSGEVTWKATSTADWITFSPATGSGNTKVTVTVGPSDDDRTGEIALKAGNIEKLITVIQTGDPHGLTEDDPLTCAEAVVLCGKLDDKATTSKKYYVKGIITAIVEEFGTEYGNATFWMGDKEGEKTFEAYRIYYFDNVKYDDPAKQNISEGDNVLIYGVLMNYGGQAETSQNAAYLVTLDANTAPALSCKEPDLVVAASETEATFTISAKNLTENWTVTTDASWIKDYTKSGSKDNTEINVSFDANADTEAREATFTVKSAGARDLVLTLKQGGFTASGTLENPYTVAEIIDAIKAGTAAGNVYIKGIVSKAVYTYSASYNTGTFWISDDGVFNDNLDKDFECYSVYWVGGSLEEPVAAADIKGNYAVGDEVVIYGATTAYTKNEVTTYETASKKAKIYSINWATTDANGLGNVDYPFNTAGAKQFIDDTQAALTAAKEAGKELALPDVAVAGKINEIVYTFSAQYGTATFWTSDDGSAKDFEAYSVYFLENQPWTEGMTQIAVGDEVILKGQLTKYKDTYETSSKKAYLYSLNGVTEAGAGPVDNWDYTPGAAYEDASNLWKANAAGNENFYYYNATGADWNGTDVVSDEVPFLTKTQSTYVLDYPEATTSGIWQKQFFIFPKDGHFVGLSADKKYSLSITVGSNVNAPAFFKIEKYDANHAKREGALIWEKGEFTLDPAAPVVIEHEIMGVDCDNVNLVFAFGGNPENAKIYIKDVVIKEVGGTPQPQPWDYTPSEAYEAGNNLWKAKAAGNEKYYYYHCTSTEWNGSDIESTEVPFLTKTQSTYELSYDAATGSAWQNQFFIFPNEGHFIPLEASKTYKLSVTLGGNAVIPGFFKIEKYSPNGPKHEGELIWEKGAVTIDPSTPMVIEKEITGVDCDNIILVFDFGGNPAEAKVYIKDITIAAPEEPQTLGEYDTNVKDAISNLTSAYTDGVATVNGVENVFTLKFGTSSKYGSATVTLPAGTKSVSFYGVGWKGSPASLKITLGGNVIPVDLKANDGATGNSPYTITVTEADKYSFNLGGALPADTPVTVETYEGNNTGKRAILFGIQASENEVQTAPKGITIDGDLSDWEGIEAFSSEATSRIREWKFSSDADNVYVYIALRKNRADSGRKLVIGFDVDDSGSLTDNNKMTGAEAIARNIIPFTNASGASELTLVTGADAGSEVVSTSGATATGAVTVWAVAGTEDMSSDSSNAYLELSIPKAKLGLSSGAVKVGASYDYYFAGWNEVTL